MKIEVYCDESRQDLLHNKESINRNNRYSIIGGIWLDSRFREELKNDIIKLKHKYDTYGEMKWRNVSNSKLDFYEEVVEVFFKYDLEVQFRCIVIDTLKVDIEKYHEGDGELGFYKFYYQLLYHWLDNGHEYYIYTDYKRNRKNNRILELKKVLNNSCDYQCVKHVQAIDSKESLILQLEDIIMGAVGYRYNYKEGGKSKAKKRIIDIMEERIGFPIGSTGKSDKKFNIFEINLNYYRGLL